MASIDIQLRLGSTNETRAQKRHTTLVQHTKRSSRAMARESQTLWMIANISGALRVKR